MGSTFRIPVVTAVSGEALVDELRAAGVTVLASVPRGGVPMQATDMRKAVAVMVGGEGSGLVSTLASAADARVTIPMQAPVESLNAAVAAALLVFEAHRQREVQS
jgi:TrmH family RNA methyltransferase